jgi:hypothetical protein
VVGALDVAAGEELEDGAADLDEVTVAQRVLVDELVVDVGAVGRAEVLEEPAAVLLGQLRVPAGGQQVGDDDVGAMGRDQPQKCSDF